MAQRITLRMILEHIQAIKNDMQTQNDALRRDFLQQNSLLNTKVDRLEMKVDAGFRECRLDIRALQEDLQATMLVQAKHGKKLSRLGTAS